jgi:hypothetical protein
MHERRRTRRIILACLLLVGLSFPELAFGYGLFTHQQLVDLAWDDSIRPLLLSRFPATTAAELRSAHAYAYGGCAIQDMGYYPFGHDFFSDLTHYVRTGDFVLSLFHHARDVNELAFASGALSHYVGDAIGHSDAVNPATGLMFPKLQKKYGPAVTYQDSPTAHVRTEFGFDIDQLSAHRFAPQAYLNFIGFRVASRLLRVAFRETYGLELGEVLGPQFPAIRSYRSSVRRFIPRFAYAEVVIHKHHFRQDVLDREFATYMQRLTEIDYGKRFAGAYRNPGIGAHVIALFIPILPRIGPLAYLAIKDPKPETEQLYVASVNRSVDLYRHHLDEFRANLSVTADLPNRDLDTGELVKPGTYRRTDNTYAKLLEHITARPERAVRPGIKRDILAYYANPNAPIATRKHKRAWRRVLAGLEQLKQMPVAAPATVLTGN